jgi:hypothetical protein
MVYLTNNMVERHRWTKPLSHKEAFLLMTASVLIFIVFEYGMYIYTDVELTKYYNVLIFDGSKSVVDKPDLDGVLYGLNLKPMEQRVLFGVGMIYVPKHKINASVFCNLFNI